MQLRQQGYKPYAPVLLLAASEDDEVSPEICRQFAETLQTRGEAIEFVMYQGAEHSYDDPGRTKKTIRTTAPAMIDSRGGLKRLCTLSETVTIAVALHRGG